MLQTRSSYVPKLETRAQRQPLAELSVNTAGRMAHNQFRTWTVFPSFDQENMETLAEYAEIRRLYFLGQIASLNAQVRDRQQRAEQLRQHIQRSIADLENIAARPRPTRLSMPLDSDSDSGSEPDISVLEMARRGRMTEQPVQEETYEEEEEEEEDSISQQDYELEDTGLDEQVEEEEVVEEQEVEPLVDPSSIGLKEISNLGKFTVSSHKPGNGVEELRSDNTKQYWQSDGPQPHNLTIYFVKRVGIRAIRFYVDYQEDESYTPTKIVFKSGTSENNLIEFATMNMESPYGWQEVPISGAGGEPDGNTLVSYVLQMQILENHQNGKDTHLRGIKIYAFDPDSPQGVAGQHASLTSNIGDAIADAGLRRGEDGGGSSERLADMARVLASTTIDAGEAGFAIPDFLREPEIR